MIFTITQSPIDLKIGYLYLTSQIILQAKNHVRF